MFAASERGRTVPWHLRNRMLKTVLKVACALFDDLLPLFKDSILMMLPLKRGNFLKLFSEKIIVIENKYYFEREEI